VQGNQGINLKLESHAVYINKEPSIFEVPLALIWPYTSVRATRV